MTPQLLTYRPFGAMRLFLALLVMLQHYARWVFDAPLPIDTGNVAVLVFFFLSGYVIIEAADTVYTRRAGAFITNRMMRIVPLFAVAVAVSFLALAALDPSGRFTDEAGAVANNPFTAHNVLSNVLSIFPLPGRFSLQPDFPVLRIAWALRVEFAFYLCVCATLLIHRMLQGRVSLPAVLAGAALVLLPLSAWHLIFSEKWNPLIGFVPFFCAGTALFFAQRGSGFAALVFVTSLTLSATAVYREAGAAEAGLFLALVFGCMALSRQRMRSPRVDRFLGDLSYPVYVGHWLPLLIFANLPTHGPLTQAAATIAGLILPLCYMAAVEQFTQRVRERVRGVAIR